MDLEPLPLRVSMDTMSGVWIVQGKQLPLRICCRPWWFEQKRRANHFVDDIFFKTIVVRKSLDLGRSCPIHPRQLFPRCQALIVAASLPHQRNHFLISDFTEFSLQFQNFIRWHGIFYKKCETRHLVLQLTLCHTQWIPCRRLAYPGPFHRDPDTLSIIFFTKIWSNHSIAQQPILFIFFLLFSSTIEEGTSIKPSRMAAEQTTQICLIVFQLTSATGSLTISSY